MTRIIYVHLLLNFADDPFTQSRYNIEMERSKACTILFFLSNDKDNVHLLLNFVDDPFTQSSCYNIEMARSKACPIFSLTNDNDNLHLLFVEAPLGSSFSVHNNRVIFIYFF